MPHAHTNIHIYPTAAHTAVWPTSYRCWINIPASDVYAHVDINVHIVRTQSCCIHSPTLHTKACTAYFLASGCLPRHMDIQFALAGWQPVAGTCGVYKRRGFLWTISAQLQCNATRCCSCHMQKYCWDFKYLFVPAQRAIVTKGIRASNYLQRRTGKQQPSEKQQHN